MIICIYTYDNIYTDQYGEQWTLKNEKQRVRKTLIEHDRSSTFWSSLQLEGHHLDRIKNQNNRSAAKKYRLRSDSTSVWLTLISVYFLSFLLSKFLGVKSHSKRMKIQLFLEKSKNILLLEKRWKLFFKINLTSFLEWNFTQKQWKLPSFFKKRNIFTLLQKWLYFHSFKVRFYFKKFRENSKN